MLCTVRRLCHLVGVSCQSGRCLIFCGLGRLTAGVSRSHIIGRTNTHTHTHTHCRTPLNEWSARRNLHNTEQKQQTHLHALSGISFLHFAFFLYLAHDKNIHVPDGIRTRNLSKGIDRRPSPKTARPLRSARIRTCDPQKSSDRRPSP